MQRNGSRPRPRVRLGYLIPEFPGQTHIWMWREITHLREWGCALQLFSTRPPPAQNRARHAFAVSACKETFYLADSLGASTIKNLAAAVVWAAITRPKRLLACIRVAFTLPVDARPRWRALLPLVPPACRLAREMERTSREHLHCHTCANGAVLAIMSRRLTGIPFSMTLNADVDWWGGAMREKTAEASFTIAISDWLLSDLRRRFPALTRDRLLLGRIGVDTRKWKPAAPRAAAAGEPLRLITVGRLHPGKGLDVLFRALEKLIRTGAGFQLRILGDGPERASLEALAAELGLQDRVCFRGSVSEDTVIQEMAEADIFVLPSHAEGLGVVVMEAMAMEIATVATSVGGLVEIITDGKDGQLVPAGDEDALACAILELAEDPELRRRLGSQGRRTIVERFDSRLGAATLFERLTGAPPPDG